MADALKVPLRTLSVPRVPLRTSPTDTETPSRAGRCAPARKAGEARRTDRTAVTDAMIIGGSGLIALEGSFMT
jgi:hypothetical protein